MVLTDVDNNITGKVTDVFSDYLVLFSVKKKKLFRLLIFKRRWKWHFTACKQFERIYLLPLRKVGSSEVDTILKISSVCATIVLCDEMFRFFPHVINSFAITATQIAWKKKFIVKSLHLTWL